MVETQFPDRVRRVSPGGVFLGHWSGAEARQRLRTRRARIAQATRSKIKAVIDLEAKVDHRIPGPQPLVYQESLTDTFRATTLKRLAPDGFRKWDPRLTFAELRAGAYVSEETRRLRREQAQF